MPAGMETLPAAPTAPGPYPLAGVVLAPVYGTVVGATNTAPIVITTATAHNLIAGVAVTIAGVVGNTAANTSAIATVLSPTTFSIPAAGNGAYISGGVVTSIVLAQSVVIADPTTAANQLTVTVSGAAKVDGTATIQPISVATLPLPQGAAQEGTDGNTAPPVPTGGSGIRGWLASIYQKLQGGIGVTGTFWQATQPVSGTISVANLPATQPVSGTVAVSALPALPGGSNALGTVGVTALPTLPGGTNAIGGVTTIGSGTVIDDTASVTSTPVALPAHACNEVQVQNDPFSAADVYLGSATGQHTRIQPGMAQTLPATNSNLFWVKTLAGTATVNILARS